MKKTPQASVIAEEVQRRQFTGWWIPVELIDTFNLKPVEALLWSEIRSLSRRERGCTASNRWLAENLGFSETWVSKLISRLIGFGLIEVTAFDGRMRTMRAVLPEDKVTPAAAQPKLDAPHGPSVKQRSLALSAGAALNGRASLKGTPYIGSNTGEIPPIPEEPEEPSAPQGKSTLNGPIGPENARRSNPLFDALALLDAPAGELTNPGRVAKALKLIRTVSPGVTAEEITRRVENFRRMWPKVTVTSTAVANHWGRLGASSNPADLREIERIKVELSTRSMPESYRNQLINRLKTLAGDDVCKSLTNQPTSQPQSAVAPKKPIGSLLTRRMQSSAPSAAS